MTVDAIFGLCGFRLTRNLYTNQGFLLLQEGTLLDKEHIEMIVKHRIQVSELDVEMDKPETHTNDQLITGATEEIHHIFQVIKSTKSIPLNDINNSILPAIHKASEFPSLFGVLSGLQAKDDYTYRHNIGVAVIATMLGKWLNLNQEDLNFLTAAAALHDVGKLNIDDSILNKPGRYTDSEYELMKQHTTFGYDIIMQSEGVSDRMALIALQHHERRDGHGYPHGVKDGNIDYFSKIVAVADIFHAMTSKRVYKEAAPFYEVISQMQNDGYGKLDPEICGVFVQRMMGLSIGSEVMLTDGRTGKIIMIPPHDPSHPLVQVGNQFVDLSTSRHINVQILLG